jgi:hypothetical protein
LLKIFFFNLNINLINCNLKGWNIHLKHDENNATNKNKKLTLLDHYSYNLAVRSLTNTNDIFNPLHLARKLFQQYVVDAFIKYENAKLLYCKRNQINFRVESYNGLTDWVNRAAEKKNMNPGKMVILPSTFKVSWNINISYN